jgi:endo-1,4-beta-xylanase
MTSVRCGAWQAGLLWAALALLHGCSDSSDPQQLEADTLRSAAANRGFYIGTSFVEGSGDPRFSPVAAEHFNALTVPLYPVTTHPAPGTYNFAVADRAVALAESAGMRMRGHPLVWGRLALPNYVANETEPAVLADWIREHVATLMTRYRGKFAQVDVVNEPLDLLGIPGPDGVPLAGYVFDELLGRDYIRIAFDAARSADPDALLFINETLVAAPGPKLDALYELVADLISEGVPIDGVGIQGHIQLLPGLVPTREELEEALARLASLGVVVELTEVDVTQREGDTRSQEDIYRDVISACLAVTACTGMTVWGVSDAYTWVEDIIGVPDPRPLLFDEQFEPKPAYQAVLEVLASH